MSLSSIPLICKDLDSFAVEIATITYRSGPEWDQRFGRQFRPSSELPETDGRRPRTPALCPDFLIETYLDHQVSLYPFPFALQLPELISFVTGRTILSQIRRQLTHLYLQGHGSLRHDAHRA